MAYLRASCSASDPASQREKRPPFQGERRLGAIARVSGKEPISNSVSTKPHKLRAFRENARRRSRSTPPTSIVFVGQVARPEGGRPSPGEIMDADACVHQPIGVDHVTRTVAKVRRRVVLPARIQCQLDPQRVTDGRVARSSFLRSAIPGCREMRHRRRSAPDRLRPFPGN